MAQYSSSHEGNNGPSPTSFRTESGSHSNSYLASERTLHPDIISCHPYQSSSSSQYHLHHNQQEHQSIRFRDNFFLSCQRQNHGSDTYLASSPPQTHVFPASETVSSSSGGSLMMPPALTPAAGVTEVASLGMTLLSRRATGEEEEGTLNVSNREGQLESPSSSLIPTATTTTGLNSNHPKTNVLSSSSSLSPTESPTNLCSSTNINSRSLLSSPVTSGHSPSMASGPLHASKASKSSSSSGGGSLTRKGRPRKRKILPPSSSPSSSGNITLNVGADASLMLMDSSSSSSREQQQHSLQQHLSNSSSNMHHDSTGPSGGGLPGQTPSSMSCKFISLELERISSVTLDEDQKDYLSSIFGSVAMVKNNFFPAGRLNNTLVLPSILFYVSSRLVSLHLHLLFFARLTHTPSPSFMLHFSLKTDTKTTHDWPLTSLSFFVLLHFFPDLFTLLLYLFFSLWKSRNVHSFWWFRIFRTLFFQWIRRRKNEENENFFQTSSTSNHETVLCYQSKSWCQRS